jgi:hypothetical protein
MPLAAGNFVQSHMAQTAPEAEVVSLEMAMKTMGTPALGIWDHILGPGAGLDLMLSSGETLHVVKTGMFPATSHVPRTLGMKMEWLREVFKPLSTDCTISPSRASAVTSS